MKNQHWLDEIKKALQEITPKLGLREEMEFSWSPMYQVAVTTQSQPTIESTFGNSPVGRIRNHGRNIFKLKAPVKKFTAAFPEDAVIFFKEKRERLIMVSKVRNLVLKLVLKPDQFELFDEEVKLLKFLKGTSFEPHISELILDGTTSNGARWIATTLGDNSCSLQNHPFPEKAILHRVHKFVLEPMTNFYKLHPWRKFSFEQWVEKAHERAAKHPQRELLKAALNNLVDEGKNHRELEVVSSQLHFDLHAGNILYDGKHITFIDWEVTHEGLLIIDAFDSYRRYVNKSFLEERKLAKFLSGNESAPLELRRFHEIYRLWMKKQFEAEVTLGSEKIVLMIYAIERTLIYWEKWEADRLMQKGFESLILQNLR